MEQPLILVTGAAGKTGREVATQLLQAGAPVRALVRRRDARSEELGRNGAEVVVAVSRAYYCPPTQPFMVQSAAAFAVAAREARLEQIVHLSQWLSSPSHPTLMTRQTWLADNLFAMVPGAAYTILNPGFFADNALRLIGFAAHLGILPSLTGDSRNAPPSNRDIARGATAVLLDPVRHDGRRYRPTGPNLLSGADMASVLSTVLGRRVRPVPMPPWLFVKAARMQGVSAFEIGVFLTYLQDHKEGAFERGAPNTDVLDVTGAPAETFETTARRYAALPAARRSTGATLRASFDVLRTPLMRRSRPVSSRPRRSDTAGTALRPGGPALARRAPRLSCRSRGPRLLGGSAAGGRMTAWLFLGFLAACGAAVVGMAWRFLGRGAAAAVAVGLPLWLLYAGWIGRSGVLAAVPGRPPGLLLLVGPAVLFVIVVARSRAGERAAQAIPLGVLIGAQVFRIGVELFLHQLALEGLSPRMLTFEGANVDLWIGLSAPVIA